MKRLLSSVLMLAFLAVSAFGQNKHWSHIWKQFNYHTPMLDYVGTVATPPADGSGHSLWSVGCETLDRAYGVFANYKEYLGELGVGYARVQSGWAKTEQKKGKYDFKWLDAIIDGIIEEGVKPWMCLCYGNPAYGAGKVLQLAVDKGCQLPGEVKLYNVPLWDAPVFIMEKSLVPMQEPAKEAVKAGGSNKESMF